MTKINARSRGCEARNTIMPSRLASAAVAIAIFLPTQPCAASGDLFQAMDVFQLEWAADPRISPKGKRIVYVRNFMDIMTDQRRSNLWIVNQDGDDHRALTAEANS